MLVQAILIWMERMYWMRMGCSCLCSFTLNFDGWLAGWRWLVGPAVVPRFLPVCRPPDAMCWLGGDGMDFPSFVLVSSLVPRLIDGGATATATATPLIS